MYVVEIDGVETTLTLYSMRGSRGYQYHTPGNTSCHSFSFSIDGMVGHTFRTNGHVYKIIRRSSHG